MYVFRCSSRLLAAFVVSTCLVLQALPVSAQSAAASGNGAQDAGPAEAGPHVHEGHDQSHAEHQHGHDDETMMSRAGSGTSWLPDDSPMYAIHLQQGPWQVMVHENLFLQYLHESGDRGDSQTGSINWGMIMAQRPIGRGTLGLRGMMSLEPWTIGGCGYPDLLASGERCDGEPIHDRQHPHDLFMEVSASYDAPLKGSIRWQIYGGPAGEPALGPVAFPHRVSALANPTAPITHHWMDSTHITFGVVTAGVYDRRWKAEASVFNGREPDSDRTDFNLSALDSVSGRFWYLPSSSLAFQVSAGRLREAEVSDTGARLDVTRVTASATYHRRVRRNDLWATTIGWGRNDEDGHASNAAMVETTVTLESLNTVFGRFEIVGKSAHDLEVPPPAGDATVSRLQLGYTRYLRAWNGFQPGVGAGLSISVVPEAWRPTYGNTANTGVAVYLTLRPAAHQ